MDKTKPSSFYLLVMTIILLYLGWNIVNGFVNGELYLKWPVNIYKNTEPTAFSLLFTVYLSLFIFLIAFHLKYIKTHFWKSPRTIKDNRKK